MLRYPHRTVQRIDDPITITIEFFVADNFARHVTRRTRIVFTPITILGPQIQAVGGAGRGQLQARLIATKHFCTFVGMQYLRAARTLDADAPTPNHHACLLVAIGNIEAITARVEQLNVAGRRFDIKDFIDSELPHPHAQGSGAKPQTDGAIIESNKLQSGTRTQAQHRRANVYFGTRAGFDPESVAAREWTIDQVIDPGFATRKLERATSVEQIDAGHATGRIAFIDGIGYRQRAVQQRAADKQQHRQPGALRRGGRNRFAK